MILFQKGSTHILLIDLLSPLPTMGSFQEKRSIHQTCCIYGQVSRKRSFPFLKNDYTKSFPLKAYSPINERHFCGKRSTFPSQYNTWFVLDPFSIHTFSLYVLRRLINEIIMSASPETDLITAGVMVCCWRAWTVCAMTFVSSSSWLLSSPWNVQKYNRFEECFAFLGTISELAEETINLLEEYVCYI